MYRTASQYDGAMVKLQKERQKEREDRRREGRGGRGREGRRERKGRKKSLMEKKHLPWHYGYNLVFHCPTVFTHYR